MMVAYRIGQELPSYAVEWRDSAGALIDFSSGYTFTFQVFNPDTLVSVFTQTSGITGSSSSPNVTVAFTAGAFDAVTAGEYVCQIIARHTGTSKDRIWPPGGTPVAPFQLLAAVT